jgi:predicted kinase
MRHLIVTMGAPGSGKSTYAAQFPYVVSTDRLRACGDDERDAISYTFRNSYAAIKQHLALGHEVVFDTTAKHPATRQQAVRLAWKYQARATLAIFDRDVEACVRAQIARLDPVPTDEVRRIHAEIRGQLSVVRFEGWSEVIVRREAAEEGVVIWRLPKQYESTRHSPYSI